MRSCTESEAVHEALHSFRTKAMNTHIELMVKCGGKTADDIADMAAEWFQKTEKRFSRFLPDSELSSLNRSAGERCMVSDAMLEVLSLADQYYKKTEGIFHPFLLQALEGSGYNQSFDLVAIREELAKVDIEPFPQPTADWSIDPYMKSVRLPFGAKLDLGGIVKSWAVDKLATHLRKWFMVQEGLINAGGDLVVWGTSEKPEQTWLVGIENPWQPEREIGTLAIKEGAAATSSKLGRTWMTDRGSMHHLIDPRTSLPSTSGVVQVTVTGPHLIECEIWSKTLCILGIEEGLEWFKRKAAGYEALLFTQDEQVHYCGNKSSVGRKWLDTPISNYHFLLHSCE